MFGLFLLVFLLQFLVFSSLSFFYLTTAPGNEWIRLLETWPFRTHYNKRLLCLLVWFCSFGTEQLDPIHKPVCKTLIWFQIISLFLLPSIQYFICVNGCDFLSCPTASVASNCLTHCFECNWSVVSLYCQGLPFIWATRMKFSLCQE